MHTTIHELENLNVLSNHIIAQTHSRVERYLVKCHDTQEKRESLEGCRIIKRISVDTKGVQLMLSSAQGASGEKVCSNETCGSKPHSECKLALDETWSLSEARVGGRDEGQRRRVLGRIVALTGV